MEYRNLPDLRALATLTAVVELGGVAEAGRALHIGQPAVTKRLRALDNCYGVALMQREGRRLELTEAGEHVYSYARLVLNHQTSLLDDLESLHAGRDSLRLEATTDIGIRGLVSSISLQVTPGSVPPTGTGQNPRQVEQIWAVSCGCSESRKT